MARLKSLEIKLGLITELNIQATDKDRTINYLGSGYPYDGGMFILRARQNEIERGLERDDKR